MFVHLRRNPMPSPEPWFRVPWPLLLGCGACVFPVDAGFECPPVVINEFLTKGEHVPDVDGRDTDWVELYNPSRVPRDLTGFLMQIHREDEQDAWDTDVSNPPWEIPWDDVLPAVVPPRGWFVVQFDGYAGAAGATRSNHAPFRLNREYGRITLLGPFDACAPVCDEVDYDMQHVDWSAARHPDGGPDGSWRIGLPSAGGANGP